MLTMKSTKPGNTPATRQSIDQSCTLTTCQTYNNLCFQTFSAINMATHLPNCTLFTNDQTLQQCPLPIAAPQIRNITCAPPLVPKPASYTPAKSTSMRCIEGLDCCIPCPAAAHFYPPKQITSTLKAAFGIRIVSVFFCLAVVISYLVLPEKRVHPRIIILFFSLTMLVWQISSIGRPEGLGTNLSCVGEVEQSEQGNNVWCAVQGIMVHYTSICLACWEVMIILNLHAVSFNWVHIFCWGAPAIPVILAYLSNSFRYTFGTFCLVSPKQSGALLFWPMVALLGPAMMVHLVTTIWILRAKKAISSRNADGAGAEWSGNGGGTRRWSGSGMQYSVSGAPISHLQYSGTGLQQYSGNGLQYSGTGLQYSSNGMHSSGNTFQGSVIGAQYSVNDMQPYLGTYGVDDGRGGGVREERVRDAAVKIVGVAAVQWRILLLSVGKMCILLAYYFFHYEGNQKLESVFTTTLPSIPTPFTQWLWCISTTSSLETCASTIAPAIPQLW
ncbi:hypothetical protein HK097_007251, partial [Rhizophlyctis rosea]